MPLGKKTHATIISDVGLTQFYGDIKTTPHRKKFPESVKEKNWF